MVFPLKDIQTNSVGERWANLFVLDGHCLEWTIIGRCYKNLFAKIIRLHVQEQCL